MKIVSQPTVVPEINDSILLVLENHQVRLAKLEEDAAHKTISKRLMASANAGALFLGLVLTFISLHNEIITKPKTERIERIRQFTDTVNAIAKEQEDLAKLAAQLPDRNPGVVSAIMPQIGNNLSMAATMLKNISKEDVGVSQLIVLAGAAASVNDFSLMKDFTSRAIAETKVSPYLHSVAERSAGQYWFFTGHPRRGREHYKAALNILGFSRATAISRIHDLADLVSFEFGSGNCAEGSTDFQGLVDTIRSSNLPIQAVQIFTVPLRKRLSAEGQHCPVPEALYNLDIP